jgi:hypothetical protein
MRLPQKTNLSDFRKKGEKKNLKKASPHHVVRVCARPLAFVRRKGGSVRKRQRHMKRRGVGGSLSWLLPFLPFSFSLYCTLVKIAKKKYCNKQMDALQAYSSSSSESCESENNDDSDNSNDAKSASSSCDLGAHPKRNRKRRRIESSPEFVRSFEHVKGNWPTYICVRIPVGDDLFQNVQELNYAARAAFEDTLAEKVPIHSSIEYITPQDSKFSDVLEKRIIARASSSAVRCGGFIHLSLSRTTTLQYHQIEHFVRDTIQALGHSQSFHTVLQGCETFSNDENTRSFVSLPVVDGREKVCNLIRLVNSVLVSYGKPVYYQNPRPHVTVASQKGNGLFGLNVIQHVKEKKWGKFRHYVRISEVSIVIGNKLFIAPLKPAP